MHVKDPVVNVRVEDYENTKTPSKHHRLDSATLVAVAFPQESHSNFPGGEMLMGQYSLGGGGGTQTKNHVDFMLNFYTEFCG